MANLSSRPDVIATWVTRLLNPAVISVAAILFLEGRPHGAWGARGLALLWGPLIPTLLALTFRWLGRSESVFIPDPRQRVLPLGGAVASCLVGVWYLGQLDGPEYLRFLMVAYAGVAAAAAVTTWWWPFSLHVAGATVPVGAGVMTVGAGYLSLVPILVLIGWARVRCREHTLAQVLAGGFVGVAVSLAVSLVSL